MKKLIDKKKQASLKKNAVDHNDILNVVHKTAESLYKSGIMDLETMRTFDAMCLPNIRPFTPMDIKKLRLREKLSQPVFAEYINASPSTVKKWETGEKHPTGPTLKLLNIIADKGIQILL